MDYHMVQINLFCNRSCSQCKYSNCCTKYLIFPTLSSLFYDNAVLQSEAHPRPIHVHLEMFYTISLQNIVTINFVTFLKQCYSKSFTNTQLYCITCSYFCSHSFFERTPKTSFPMSLFTAYNAIIDQ